MPEELRIKMQFVITGDGGKSTYRFTRYIPRKEDYSYLDFFEEYGDLPLNDLIKIGTPDPQ